MSLEGKMFVYKDWPSTGGYFMVMVDKPDKIVLSPILHWNRAGTFAYGRESFDQIFKELPRDDCFTPEVMARFDIERLARWAQIKWR